MLNNFAKLYVLKLEFYKHSKSRFINLTLGN